MTRVYTGEWNGFQFRSPTYLDGHFEPYEFDLVKWKECEPMEMINLLSGEKTIQTRYCYSVGKLIWNKNEQAFTFESVGLRYLTDRVDGLEEWILKFCEEMEKEL